MTVDVLQEHAPREERSVVGVLTTSPAEMLAVVLDDAFRAAGGLEQLSDELKMDVAAEAIIRFMNSGMREDETVRDYMSRLSLNTGGDV